MIDDALSRGIAGDFTFDSYFTHARILNHIHANQRHYVGALKLNRKVVFDGREHKLQEVASQIPFTDKKAVWVGKRCYWYFSKRMRIQALSHPVRIVLFWKDRQATEASKALVSNRVVWEVLRMLKVYRHRWTGTETFHRDAKQQLGLGDCQVRSGKESAPDLIRGADPPHVPCQRSVQSSPEPVEGCTPCMRALRMNGLAGR